MKRSQAPSQPAGQPESPESKETFPHRTERPGEAGLANEARPGLGSRGDDGLKPLKKTPPSRHDQEPLGRNAPLVPREPQEAPNPLPAAQERDTGAAGQMGLK